MSHIDDDDDDEKVYTEVKLVLTVQFRGDYHSPDEFGAVEGWVTSALDDRDDVIGGSCEIISQTFPNA